VSKILAYYDLRGIQDFIFASNKLKENVGASLIVQRVLDTFLEDIILKCKKNGNDAELIYSGGGNAMAEYGDDEIYRDVNMALSRKILEETGNAIRFASAYAEGDCSDFPTARDAVLKELAKNKYQGIQTSPLPGIAITREGLTDGLPAQKECKKQSTFYSLPAWKKREVSNSEYYEQEIKIPGNYTFAQEFDDLGRRTGESHIAVVHIDGNNMGKKINRLKSYDEMKEFSDNIKKAYKEAMIFVTKELVEALNETGLAKELDLKTDENDKLIFPLRIIVLNGDDVTFVTDGRLGLALANLFLQEVHNNPITVGGKPMSLSACAGIAIVKSHFPFYRAYQLAEELCRSAKTKGKILFKQKKNSENEEMGSWLDFHIVYSGITTKLEELRTKQYNIPGYVKAESFTYPPRSDTPDMELKSFNLLWRPWCAAGQCEEKYKWKHLMKILKIFKEEWPRSRLKRLRNDSVKSKADVDNLLKEFKSRGKELSPFMGERDYLRDDNRSPYFDAVELLDFYEFPVEGGDE